MIPREKVAAELARWYGHPDATTEFRRAADVAIAAYQDTLRADGYVVIKLPEVAHKGPHDTDAKFYRQVAERMEEPHRHVGELSGSNVRNAVRDLLYLAADAAEAKP